MRIQIKELGDVYTGSTPSKKNHSYYDSNDICFIKPDIISDIDVTELSFSNEYISENARSKSRIVPKNSILVTCIGSIGKIGIVRNHECAFNQQINAIVPNSMVIPEYLAYCLLYNKKRLLDMANAPVVPIINKTQFENFDICISENLDKQRRELEILNGITTIIKIRKQQLKQLDLLIKARFVEMFGDPIQNPMRWHIKPLKELSALITNGNTPKGGSENYVESGIVFLRSQNVWRNKIVLDDVVYIDEKTHNNMRKSSVNNNDILITKTGRINTENSSLGRAALYRGENGAANINGHVYLVRLSDMVNPQYVVTILTGEAYRKYIRKVCVGGIDKRQINLDQVENFPIIMPPLELQTQFAAFVEAVDKSKVVYVSL